MRARDRAVLASPAPARRSDHSCRTRPLGHSRRARPLGPLVSRPPARTTRVGPPARTTRVTPARSDHSSRTGHTTSVVPCDTRGPARNEWSHPAWVGANEWSRARRKVPCDTRGPPRQRVGANRGVQRERKRPARDEGSRPHRRGTPNSVSSPCRSRGDHTVDQPHRAIRSPRRRSSSSRSFSS